ncbi:MAG TPA: radical SAM protein [Anaerolineae bacterium]|nr:radical SAM protein [Anaerolineae bacterium]
MRILFVEKQIDYAPLGVLYLASALRNAGHEVRLAVAAEEDPVAAARAWQPHVLGYSVYTGSQTYYRDLNLQIRAALGAALGAAVNAVSVFGGPHPTYFPEFVEEPGVDAVCLGEGEGAMLDLVAALEAGRPLTGIENWWFKRDGEIERNPVRDLEDDLDRIPFPDRDLLFARDALARQSGIKHFITSRGCPYDCAYCFNHALAEIYRGKGRRLRQMSVDRVVEEVKAVGESYPMQFVVFLDDLFIVNTAWLRELAAKFPRQVGLPFFCNVRANLVTPEKVDLLRQAGCASVGMGLETGNPEVRNGLLGRNLSDAQIVEASRLIRQAGIQLLTTNMVGLPGGTLEHDLETLALNHACQPAYANAFLYQPYPRTRLGEYAREHGYVEGSIDDIDPSAWERSVLRFASPGEKRQIENLNKLFALAVEWPWLARPVQRLIKLPPNPVFRLAYKLWKGYAVKSRIHPYRPSPREFLQTVRRFMRFD